MGRKTFEIMPNNIFNDRIPIVFSRNKFSFCFNNKRIQYTIVSSIQEFLLIYRSWNYSQAFIIGGAQIAHLFLEYNLISEFIITKIHKQHTGNIYFNLRLLERWHQTCLIQKKDYTIYKLIRNTYEDKSAAVHSVL